MGKEIDHPLMENRTGITEDKKSNHIWCWKSTDQDSSERQTGKQNHKVLRYEGTTICQWSPLMVWKGSRR
jgi:hypothetical protein